jgi:hypothetical protein
MLTIRVTATEDWITVDGVLCRMWDGTLDGIPIQAAIARVAPRGGYNEAFEKVCVAAGLRAPDHPDSRAQVIADVPQSSV